VKSTESGRRLLAKRPRRLVRVAYLEIYRDPSAYQAHLLTPHFERFRAPTKTYGQVRSGRAG
jgi:quinol monooxygenase YgiN